MGTKRVQSAANFELATRSLAGSIIYPCIALILYGWSPFYRDHPLLSLFFIALMSWVGWERIKVARRIQADQGEVEESLSLRLHRITLATAVIWGVFAGWGIYHHDDVTRWMILTADGSLASGAIASLSPGRDRLFLKYITLLLTPSIVVMLLGPGEVSRATGWIAFGFAFLVGFHGHFQSLGYHENLHQEALFTDELLSARERLELVVKGSNLGTFDWFPSEYHLDIDDKLWETLKLPVPVPERASGMLMKTIHRDDLERHRKIIGTYLKDDQGVCEVDFRLRAADEHFEIFRFRGKVVRRNSQGRATRVSGTFLDITAEIEAAEEKARWQAQVQQSEKLKTLGILAGGVAHDFNNLLASYIGSLELIELQVEPDAPFLSDLQRARDSAMEAASLCDQLLSYAGKRSLHCERFCLNTLIYRMAQLLAVSTSSDTEIKLQLAEQLPLLEGDPSQLRQVVLNLILNAAEAMDGVGQVEVSTRLEQGRLWLTVKDHGSGMEPEVVARIFDPFFTTKFTGRGLGLAAVFGIVEAHRGKIQVDTEVGRGTTVTVCLPFVEGSLPAPVTLTPAATPDRPGTILVVDDEPALLGIYSKILRRQGHQVVTAGNGLEALELLAAEPSPCAIILDLTMPKLGGLETLGRLRKTHPEVPVLLASGYSEQDVSANGNALYQGFLKKPFSARQLQSAVSGLLTVER